MEQRPDVPGYGKGRSMENDLDREMTIEEIDAMEVPTVEVVKKGVVQSKVEALRKPNAAEQKQVRDMIVHQIDALMMQPVHTDIERRVRDLKVEKLKEKMEGIGHKGNA